MEAFSILTDVMLLAGFQLALNLVQVYDDHYWGEGRGVRDLQLPESPSYIYHIPVYRTDKMKNTVTGKTAD